MTRRFKSYTLNGLIYILALIWLVPLMFMIVSTFQEHNSVIVDVRSWFMPPFTTENYVHVFQRAPIMRWMWNSFIVAAFTTLGVCFISAFAAFGLTIRKSPLSAGLSLLILAGIMVPVEAMLVPLFTLCLELGLLNNIPSLILPFLAAPFSIIILQRAFQSLPEELFEAAEMDGCNSVRLFFLIALPLIRASLATVAILTFLGSWNSFLWPFLSINSEAHMTITIGLPYFRGSGMGDGFQLPMTASFIAVIPTIVFFFLFQKFIMKGISTTGGK